MARSIERMAHAAFSQGRPSPELTAWAKSELASDPQRAARIAAAVAYSNQAFGDDERASARGALYTMLAGSLVNPVEGK